VRWHLACDTDFKTVDRRLSGRFGDWRGLVAMARSPEARLSSLILLLLYGYKDRPALDRLGPDMEDEAFPR